MIIDSHCHLTYEPLINSLEDTINRANKDGVKYLLTISTEDKSFDKILQITKNYKCVYGTYGIHPHEAKNHKNLKSIDIINKINKSKKIIGIGETGLDFYYNYSDEKDQIDSFLQHISLFRGGLKNSLNVFPHLEHIILPLILFFTISKETFNFITISIFCSYLLSSKFKFLA